MPASAAPKTNGLVGTSLVDTLVSRGVLASDIAEKIKLQEIQTGKPQEELVTSVGKVKEEDLSRAKAAFYNVPFLDLNQTPISPEALAVLPQSVAARFSVLPIAVNKDKNILDLAMANPLDLTTVEFVEQKTGMRVKPVAVVPSLLTRLVSERYSIGLSEEVTTALKETGASEKTIDLTRLSEVISEAPIAKIVKELLAFAVKSRASDIHIEPEERQTRVRYRIDGILQEKFTMPRQFHDALISRIKILSGMKIDEKRIPQDGRFNFKSGAEEVDLRVSSLPIVHGEKIVMRLLKKSGGVPDLPDLGLRGRALKNLQDAILRPHGIILVTGPTGSGKTTTLYSVLSKINTPKVNILTLEDPVEYKIAGVNQVQINPDAGLTFATGLRSFLRQDPNIIMVGEIRDQETAQLAIQAALTGHLVFSTLHTNSASGALPRLVDMGAEPFLLASTITCIVAQRVCRKIHESCREEYLSDETITKDIKNVLGNLFPASAKGAQEKQKADSNPGVPGIKLYKGKGDQEDGNTGYMGRIGIYEVMPITEKIGRLAIQRESAESIQKVAEEEGMITMKQDGYLKALEGITALEEVLRVAQE